MSNKLWTLVVAGTLLLPAMSPSFAANLQDRDLAIATLLYAQVAGETCADVRLNTPARSTFMTDNGLKETDLDRTSAQWGEIEEALNELAQLFREENVGACNTAWLLLGKSGYMASDMLVRTPETRRAAR